MPITVWAVLAPVISKDTNAEPVDLNVADMETSDQYVLSDQVHTTQLRDENASNETSSRTECLEISYEASLTGADSYFDRFMLEIHSIHLKHKKGEKNRPKISILTSTSPMISDYELRPRTSISETNDDNFVNVNQTSIDILYEWVSSELLTGHVLSLKNVKNYYLQIKKEKQESVTEYMLRTSTVKTILKQKFEDEITFFDELSQSGTYVAFNDVKFYALKLLQYQQNTITTSVLSKQHKSAPSIQESEMLFSSIRLLRGTFDEAFEKFNVLSQKPEQLQYYTPEMY
ncbi:unnamed protein product [Didymodactylos carnosus]|uniref:Uncharacterized protein n=1 Tax=Didymodactylos carnosus TaxID=1234261 RepID=A0A814YHL2_9BILA|nr:unnamed protein product [Didymodactylos carnosus]CAF1228858.1 unnamed protein product [Didymodactylos carnosus]CAF3538484.1 unnamed protein product [Didymodactylos carnosus]CAF3991598.1 unnamed protein product [Didymodactylos carnosus]